MKSCCSSRCTTPICRWCGGPAAWRNSCGSSRRHWRFDDEDLAAAFSDKTRVVLFNNPLNPAACVYDEDDLKRLAAFCRRFDAIAICDEVWEHVVFDGRKHMPLIAMEGMRERTVKIGSAGKIFSMTGWKVGFVCACPAAAEGSFAGAPVPDLHDAAQPADGGRLRPWQRGRLFRRHAPTPAAQPRSARRRIGVRSAGARCRAKAPISSMSTSPRSATTTTSSAIALLANMASRPFPFPRFTRKRRCAAPSGCASPSAIRPWTRRLSGWRK